MVGAVIAYRYLRVPENRAARRGAGSSGEPSARCCARWPGRPDRCTGASCGRRARGSEPGLRFLWERLTPGELGLELTTLLAVAAVGSYAFLGVRVERHRRRSARSDTRAFDVVSSIETRWLTDVVKVVTASGRSPVTGAAALAAVGFLLARRRADRVAVALASGTC